MSTISARKEAAVELRLNIWQYFIFVTQHVYIHCFWQDAGSKRVFKYIKAVHQCDVNIKQTKLVLV